MLGNVREFCGNDRDFADFHLEKRAEFLGKCNITICYRYAYKLIFGDFGSKRAKISGM